MSNIENERMMRSPYFSIGAPPLIIGLLTIPMQQREGMEWVPIAMAAFGATLILIKLVWVVRHRREIQALVDEEKNEKNKNSTS